MLDSAMLDAFARELGDGVEAWLTAEANKEASFVVLDTILCCCLVNVPMEPKVLERVDNLRTCEQTDGIPADPHTLSMRIRRPLPSTIGPNHKSISPNFSMLTEPSGEPF